MPAPFETSASAPIAVTLDPHRLGLSTPFHKVANSSFRTVVSESTLAASDGAFQLRKESRSFVCVRSDNSKGARKDYRCASRPTVKSAVTKVGHGSGVDR